MVTHTISFAAFLNTTISKSHKLHKIQEKGHIINHRILSLDFIKLPWMNNKWKYRRITNISWSSALTNHDSFIHGEENSKRWTDSINIKHSTERRMCVAHTVCRVRVYDECMEAVTVKWIRVSMYFLHEAFNVFYVHATACVSCVQYLFVCTYKIENTTIEISIHSRRIRFRLIYFHES